MDFFGYRRILPLLHTRDFFTAPGFPFLYPATGIPMYVLFSFHHALRVFLLVCGICWGGLVVTFWRSLRTRGLCRWKSALACVVPILCSYPLAFSIQRGNFETLLAFGIAFGTWAFLRRRYKLSAILWAFFGCIKLYPLLLLALFIPKRRFKEIGLGLSAAAAFTILALWYVGPSTRAAYDLSKAAVDRFMSLYPFSEDVQGYEHSFFGLAKILLRHSHWNAPHLWHRLSWVMASAMTVLYLWRIVRLPLANQLLFLTIGMIALPPYSFDYTLLHLYAAWAVIALGALDEQTSRKPVLIVMVLLAVLLSPQNYVQWKNTFYSGALKALLLGALLLITCSWRLGPSTNSQGEV